MSTPEIPEPVASFITAVNRHDEDGFLNAFTRDGLVDDWGRIFSGREAIKAWSDGEFIGAAGTLTPTRVTQLGTKVTVVGEWSSTFANGLSRFDFTVAGGKISRMTIREG
ncbi:nuclear transport factor 2 family protein [Pseudoclavibacter sp. CFCC 13796]|uniref:nuclear transport factor 2 family protein n=1 Tax=Pseudoclavibacter sp. CFCC 13796 TaxID=2615179 RepID=UPI001301149B|nr:nuclear transport factor 2 family protein [Pseudoclavibacter sp. CFCC 13796]KAB1661099.1 nuclear transport factor 2 family protein [Pseudoclavibacter sp. CFCC 13796]